jgi:LAS superfamily LD-carboxypeptidase LdcB
MKRLLSTFITVTVILTVICYFIFETPWRTGTGSDSLIFADGYHFYTSSGSAVSGTEQNTDSENTDDGNTSGENTDDLLPDDIDSILVDADTVPLDTLPDSITALVNRNYLLPSSYVPSHLVEPKVRFSFDYKDDKRLMRKEAAAALEKMFRSAKKQKKLILYGVSGYRSYHRQREIYLHNVALRGRSATDSFSAKPGSSEHQTGLTIDISCASIDNSLSRSFANTKEGKWVAKNAHKYGFIIRYPAGKSKITGYEYEPWHIRYVGVKIATYLYKNNLTLEEYYGIGGKK